MVVDYTSALLAISASIAIAGGLIGTGLAQQGIGAAGMGIDLYSRKKSEEALLIEKRELDAAEFEAKKIVRDKVAELINVNVDKGVIILENLRNTEEYKEILNKMIQVSKKLLGTNCTVRVNPADTNLITDSSVTIVKDNVDKYGGIIAESEDKEVDLTISSIIKNLRERIAMELSNIVGEH